MNNFKIIFFTFLIFFQKNYNTKAQNSVLSQGTWYKIPITESGIYKIDANLLRQNGINPQNINPKNIHIFGNSGAMLPQANATTRPQDLQENPILVKGEEDERFDEQDYIIFYAESSDIWKFDVLNQTFSHQKNYYDTKNYVFLNINNIAGLRLNTKPNLGTGSQVFNDFDERIFYEKNLKNPIRSGRTWYGEEFAFQTELTFNVSTPQIVPNSTAKITSAVMCKDVNPTSFQLFTQNTSIGTQNISAVPNDTYAPKGAETENIFAINSNFWGNTENLALRYKLNQTGNSATGYLNYFRVHYKRNLTLSSTFLAFRNVNAMQFSQSSFEINQADGEILIWDITQPQNPRNQAFTQIANRINFGTNTNNLPEFIAFRPANIANVGETWQTINNQNLRADNTPDFLIITHPLFSTEAQRLANFRTQNDNMQVKVSTTDEIYNEFSSGKADISALRDYIKYLYQKNPQKLKYVLLFGGASYDYLSKTNTTNNTNFIPIYESIQSLHPIFSYSSDDYFGMLGNDEGEWTEDDAGNKDMEVGIGRFPVKNTTEARIAVDKSIRYADLARTAGVWRQKIAFVADDGDNNVHQQDADNLAEWIESNAKTYEPQKMFLDSYVQTTTPAGETCFPLAKEIDKDVNNGVLIMNYTGHGGEVGWTDESILRAEQIKSWKNANNMPLFMTATCEFGRYDNPQIISAAEDVFLSEKGGGIALLTTTRPVFSSTNLVINKAFYQNAFTRLPNGQMPRLGDIVKMTKNQSMIGVINRNFALLGDPSVQLAYPKHKIVLTEINGQNANVIPTLKATQNIILTGQIQDQNQNLLANFNGTIFVEVSDKRNTTQTLGTSTPKMPYQVRNAQLFRGQASVINGIFSINFIVPKDIQYNVGLGKISFYAQDLTNKQDAGGFYLPNVGGTNLPAVADNTPPQIQLFMDNEDFKNGGEVQKNTIFLAKLSDENGINISRNGIGHELKAILDDSITLILNDYYRADLDTYKSDKISYPLQNLAQGRHSITLEAWDTFNNNNKTKIDFIVGEAPQISFGEISIYPNPMTDFAIFKFEHNKIDLDLDIRIEIVDMQGKKIDELTAQIKQAPKIIELRWNIGQNITKSNVMIAKIFVNSPQDNTKGNFIKKLVKIF
jgi:hypothetical protein